MNNGSSVAFNVFSSAHKNTIKKLMAQTVGTGETELEPGYVWSELAVDRLKSRPLTGALVMPGNP